MPLRCVATLLCLLTASFSAAVEPIDRAWYTPVELLTKLAERDDIRSALPETLSGRALVGGTGTHGELLDQACKQWQLAWMKQGDVVVVDRAQDDRLKQLTDELTKGDAAAAWELGWLRDARAIPPLSTALLDKNIEVTLAAAQAIEVLDTLVPLGRDERVDPLPPGRIALAAAFPPAKDVSPLLASPYPSLRAAALRLLLAQGGDAAEAAKKRTASDTSASVRRVWQQQLTTPPAKSESRIPPLMPAPQDAAELQAACDKLVGELPALEKQSAWEQMQWRAQSMAEWSRQDHPEGTAALLKLCDTKIQHGWFPGWVQRHLAATGRPEVTAKFKEGFEKLDRDALVRGLERSCYGESLLDLTRPHLSEQTVCYVTTRKAGREAYDDLLALAAKGNFAAIDALGVIGGPQAVETLQAQLMQDSPEAGTVAFRSAKALGRIGSPAAIEALLAASASPIRYRRHAATLFLGHAGGPQAVKPLRDILSSDDDRLVRAAAADALEQIGDPESIKLVAAFRDAERGLPKLVYRSRNPRFGEDFPVNEWVNLKIGIQTYAAAGEIGWNYDAANRLFFRYGGCSGYTNELTLFDLGTEQFQQRRPNEEMAGWGDRRPSRGCSGGRCWDPHGKLAWLGPVIGGSDADLAIAEYYNPGGAFSLGSYDLATDRFRAAPRVPRVYGEPSQRYATDWQRGLLFPVKFSPFPNEKPFFALDVKGDPYRSESWLDKTNRDGDYPRKGAYCTAAVDQDAGLLVLYAPPKDDKPAQTWTYDPAANRWTNMAPSKQPQGQSGAGFVYDPFHKLLLLQSGQKVSQYGGADDSITWTYDVRANTWTDLATTGGPGNPWVGAMDFDPEHNVFVLFNNRDRQVWAYRYRAVKEGTEAVLGGK